MFKQLIINSIKFTKKGSIKIRVYKEEIEGKKYQSINIDDTGIGIPKNKLKQIFEEFRQVSEGINRKFEGLGLGLTFVARIIDIMNCKIDIKSRLNEGTTVKISIPAS